MSNTEMFGEVIKLDSMLKVKKQIRDRNCTHLRTLCNFVNNFINRRTMTYFEYTTSGTKAIRYFSSSLVFQQLHDQLK